MLPVPYDRLVAALVQFNAMQPPFIPQVNCPMDLQSYIPHIASQLLNEVASKANLNHSRLFTHNLLNLNNYQNAYYQEALELALWVIYLNIKKGVFRSIEQAIQPSVESVATLITSRYVFEFQELKSVCDPRVVHAASQNYGFLNNLKQEIAMYQQPAQQPIQYPYQQYPQQVQYPQPVMMPMMQQPMQQPYVPFGGTPSIGTVGQTAAMQSRATTSDRYDRDVTNMPIMTTEPVNSTVTEQRIIPLKDAEMKREQHILFAGDTYRLDYAKRAVTANENSQSLILAEVESENTYLNPNILMSTSMDMSIFESCIIQRQKQNDATNANFFRYFAYIVEPFVTSENYRDVVESVITKDSIAEMSTVLKASASSLNSIEHQNKLELINIIEYLDRLITAAVNSYMGTELGLNVTIDSVITDGADLVAYLKSGLEPRLVNKFLEWEKTLKSSLKSLDENEETSFKEGMIEGAMVNLTLVPTCVTITLVQLMNKELGFKLMPGKVYTIDPVRHSMIYNIARSLSKHSESMDLKPLYNYLVTLDKVKYTLHKSDANTDIRDDVYMIKLA